MADTRASTYLDGDTRVWRASSFGFCEQYLVRVATGQTPAAPPQSVVEAMETSADHEPDILADLQRRGWRLFDHHELKTKMHSVGKVDARTGQLECELKVPGGVIRCHPDGIAERFKAKVGENPPLRTRVVVEVKALRKGSWPDPLAKESYAWQGSIESAVTKLPLLFVVGWKDEDGGLIYDGEELDLTIAYVERDKLPHTKAEIIGRAARLNKMIRDVEEGRGLPACDFKMWPCGFWMEHDKSEGSIWHDAKVELDADVEPNVRYWAFKYDEARADEKKASEAKKKAGGKIKELLEGAGVEVGVAVAGEFFEYQLVESRTTRYDAEKAKKDGVDLDKYKVSTPYTYAKVVRTGDD